MHSHNIKTYLLALVVGIITNCSFTMATSHTHQPLDFKIIQFDKQDLKLTLDDNEYLIKDLKKEYKLPTKSKIQYEGRLLEDDTSLIPYFSKINKGKGNSSYTLVCYNGEEEYMSMKELATMVALILGTVSAFFITGFILDYIHRCLHDKDNCYICYNRIPKKDNCHICDHRTPKKELKKE